MKSIAVSWAAIWLGSNGVGVFGFAGIGVTGKVLFWSAVVWPATGAKKAPKKDIASNTTSNGAKDFIKGFFINFFLLR